MNRMWAPGFTCDDEDNADAPPPPPPQLLRRPGQYRDPDGGSDSFRLEDRHQPSLHSAAVTTSARTASTEESSTLPVMHSTSPASLSSPSSPAILGEEDGEAGGSVGSPLSPYDPHAFPSSASGVVGRSDEQGQRGTSELQVGQRAVNQGSPMPRLAEGNADATHVNTGAPFSCHSSGDVLSGSQKPAAASGTAIPAATATSAATEVSTPSTQPRLHHRLVERCLPFSAGAAAPAGMAPVHHSSQNSQHQGRPHNPEYFGHVADGTPSVHYTTLHISPPVCASATTSSRDWVRLNVGGRVFVTTLATLCSDPNSLLARICEPLMESRRVTEGEEGQPLTSSSFDPRRGRGQQQQQHRVQSSFAAATTSSPHSPSSPFTRNGEAVVEEGSISSMGGRVERTSAVTRPGSNAAGSTAHTGAGAPSITAGAVPSAAAAMTPGTAGSIRSNTPRRPMHMAAGGGYAFYLSSGGYSTFADTDAGGGELASPCVVSATTPLDVDEHNSILLDLDPDYFAPVLNYLRHRTVVIPASLSARGVLAVAEYLNVQGMVRQLAPERRVRRQVLSSWGSGGSGELGTQRFQDSDTPTPVQVTPFGVKVVHMALGANYSCALSDDGNIYTFGNGDWGQLGIGSPKELEVHPVDRSAVLAVPRRIPLFERHPALHVSAGYAFAMAIISDYHVYFWGNNNHGQSGLGPRYFDVNTRKVDEPKRVDTLEDRRIVQIGCGSFFSLALGEDGTLYSWGLVECLGLGPPEEVRKRFCGTDILAESLSSEKRSVVLTPQVVTVRSSSSDNRGGQQHPIVRIHAGQWHSGAINSAGELFTWGVGYQGRLGHGTKEPAYRPTKVRGALADHRVVDVACGSFHTVALTDRGVVFCWGDNASGQCGTSVTHAETVMSPYRVVGLEFIAGGVAKGISCGRQHTVVVMEGPQTGCLGACCQLDYRGRPRQPHAQVYTFGEGARGIDAANATGVGNLLGGVAGSGAVGNSGNSGVRGARVRMTALLSAYGGPQGGGTGGSGGTGGNQGTDDGSGGGGGTAGVGVSARTSTQYQVVHGLERMNVIGVVSGLHHTFVYAEEIEASGQSYSGGGDAEGVSISGAYSSGGGGGGACGGYAGGNGECAGATFDSCTGRFAPTGRFADRSGFAGGPGPGGRGFTPAGVDSAHGSRNRGLRPYGLADVWTATRPSGAYQLSPADGR